MFQYPASPIIGDTFNPVPGVTYRWNGTAWYLLAGPGAFITQIDADARYIQLTAMGVPLGVATLDATGKVPLSQLPPPGVFTDLVVSGNTTLGDAAADTLTVNAGTWTLNPASGFVATLAAGALPPAALPTMAWNYTYSGNVSGTSFPTVYSFSSTSSGANALGGLTNLLTSHTHAGSALSGFVVGTQHNLTLTGSGGITDAVGDYNFIGMSGAAAGNITNATVYDARPPGLGGGSLGTYGTFIGYRANNFGHATRVGAAYSFSAADHTLGPNPAAAYRSQVSAGANKYGLFFDGNAGNYLAGGVGFGPNVREFYTSFAGFWGPLQTSVLTQFGLVSTYIANDAFTNSWQFIKGRGTYTAPLIVQNGDTLGGLVFSGVDTANTTRQAAGIFSNVDGAPALGSIPGRLDFRTNAVGAGSTTIRLRIDSNGKALFSLAAVDYVSTALGNPAGVAIVGQAAGAGSPNFHVAYASDNAGNEPSLSLTRTRSTWLAATAVQSGDSLGSVWFAGTLNAATMSYVGRIKCTVDGAPGVAVPTMLTFHTTPVGGGMVERMRIDSIGATTVFGTMGITNPAAAQPALFVVAGVGAVAFDLRGRVADGISTIRWMSNNGVTQYAGLNADSSGALTFYAGAAVVAQFQIVNNAAATAIPLVSGNVGFATVGTSAGDLALSPVTNIVRFGTFTASGDVPVTGSVLIKDAAGNNRKLAVVA